jgi:plasmid stabilization system protein ParE
MNYRLVIRPEAEDDLKEAFSWYEDKRNGLGYDFLLQVEAGLRFIEKIPRFSKKNIKVQENISLKGFPTK